MRASLTDVMIAFVLVAILAVSTLAARDIARSRSVSVACASNLRQIGIATTLYLIDHRQWPRTRYDADHPAPTAFTAPFASNPFAPDGPASNDVTAAAHLLIGENLPPDAMICPNSPLQQTPPPSAVAMKRSNFVDRSELGYSFANPYPSREAATAGYRLDDRLTAEFAVASDMNPGSAQLLTADRNQWRSFNDVISLNHRSPRQMFVLYGDGHVDAVVSPFQGVQRDNIFTTGGPGAALGGTSIVGSPVDANDSVLLPVADLAAWQPILDAEAIIQRRRLATWIACGSAIAGIVAWLTFNIRRSHTKGVAA